MVVRQQMESRKTGRGISDVELVRGTRVGGIAAKQKRPFVEVKATGPLRQLAGLRRILAKNANAKHLHRVVICVLVGNDQSRKLRELMCHGTDDF